MESYSIQDLENKLISDKAELQEIESLLEEDSNDDELQNLKNDLISIIKTTTDLIIKKQRETTTNTTAKNISNHNVTTHNNNTTFITNNNTTGSNNNNNFNTSSATTTNGANNNNHIIAPPPAPTKQVHPPAPPPPQPQITTFNMEQEDDSGLESSKYMTVGSICEGQYSLDNIWYKAKIDSINKDGTFVVTYLDYGNSETLTFDKIRPPTRSLKLIANQNLEQKKYLQAPETIQAIPKSLKILPEDSEEVKKQKQKKIHSIKSMNRLKKVEEEGKQKTQAWKDFVNKPKKSMPGTFTDKKKTSMFSTGDGIHSKVGVIGSGRGMTEAQQFQSLSKKSSSVYPTNL